MFRLKVVDGFQATLFRLNISRVEFVTKLILEIPNAEIRRGYTWHIGNVQLIGDEGLVFAVGRTTRTSKELYDESTRNFVAVEDRESPFTRVFYEKRYGILGILPRARLSPTAKGIATGIARLLNAQPVTRSEGVHIEIAELWDPEDFLMHLRIAYAVIGFTVHFGHPNPFDVEKDFHRPMERYLQATSGTRGKATVQGPDLDRKRLEEITRSVASTGNDVSARIRTARGHRPVTRHMRGNPVVVSLEEYDNGSDDIGFARRVLEEMRETYRRLRRYDRQ